MKVTLEQMIIAGIHLGHPTPRWHPKMITYTYGSRKGIHVIDLVKTRQQLEKAEQFLTKIRRKGRNILFVGTKKQAAEIIKDRAKATNSFFVRERWLGGILTNWSVVQASLLRLHYLERKQKESFISRKEAALLAKRLERYLGGLKGMQTLPGVVIIVGQKDELTAIQECRKLGIPTVCRLDTDCNPRLVDIGVPINDDSRTSISLFLETLLPRIQEGRLCWLSEKVKKQVEIDSLVEEKRIRVLKKTLAKQRDSIRSIFV
jgi:small subunit ribosomal protein S2